MKQYVTTIAIFFFFCVGGARLSAQSDQPSDTNKTARSDFQDRKFGMFIHWGIYSILGDGEWVMHKREIPYKDYSRITKFFRPEEFNAVKWVATAKAAGMKYITITSRHHDGFSMFATKATPYNIVDATPYKKDPLKALADECHKQGIKLFFYYSLLDWGRKDYGFGQPIVDGKPKDTDWDSYIAFMKNQLTELLTNYGEISGIWFDGEWERKDANWRFDEIYALIHKLQPQAMIGNNHHHAVAPGEDFQMFEKDLPGNSSHGWGSGAVSTALPLETCETMNNSWGFNLNDHKYKSTKELVHYIVNAACRNANFLLNVGPMPNGEIQSQFTDTLKAIGNWMNKYGEAVYGTRGEVIAPQDWGGLTQKGKTLYAHIVNTNQNEYLFIPGLKQKVVSATALTNNKKLKIRQQAEGVFVYLDGVDFDPFDTVVKLDIK